MIPVCYPCVFISIENMNQVTPLSYYIYDPYILFLYTVISYPTSLVLPLVTLLLTLSRTILSLAQAIASFMIHSAVALAEQLKKCGGLQLREEDMRKWERELRVLNVTRASLTTQLVAARKQVMHGRCRLHLLYPLICHLIHYLTSNIIVHPLMHLLTYPNIFFSLHRRRSISVNH